MQKLGENSEDVFCQSGSVRMPGGWNHGDLMGPGRTGVSPGGRDGTGFGLLAQGIMERVGWVVTTFCNLRAWQVVMK